jgi:hypothetical protein
LRRWLRLYYAALKSAEHGEKERNEDFHKNPFLSGEQ